MLKTSTAKADKSTADNSDMPARTMDVEERPIREASRRVDQEIGVLIALRTPFLL